MMTRFRTSLILAAVAGTSCGGRVADSAQEVPSGGAASGGTTAVKTETGGHGSVAETGGHSSGMAETGGAAGLQGAQCADVIPCGGNIVGSWVAVSSCLVPGGSLDLSLLGLGCPGATILDGSLSVSGTWIANPDGSLVDQTTTSGVEHVRLPASCLNIAGTTTTCDRIANVMLSLGYSASACTPASGEGCDCTVQFRQRGGLAVVSALPVDIGTYWVTGTTVTIADETSTVSYSYCASDSMMTLTPHDESTLARGVIKFQRNTI